MKWFPVKVYHAYSPKLCIKILENRYNINNFSVENRVLLELVNVISTNLKRKCENLSDIYDYVRMNKRGQNAVSSRM